MVGLAPAEIKVFAGALQNGLSRITNLRQAILQTTMALETTNNNHGADLQPSHFATNHGFTNNQQQPCHGFAIRDMVQPTFCTFVFR